MAYLYRQRVYHIVGDRVVKNYEGDYKPVDAYILADKVEDALREYRINIGHPEVVIVSTEMVCRVDYMAAK